MRFCTCSYLVVVYFYLPQKQIYLQQASASILLALVHLLVSISSVGSFLLFCFGNSLH
jgi:hypothetical protein